MKTKHRNQAHAKRIYRADPTAIFRVFGRVTGFTEAEQCQINLPVRVAYESLLNGRGEESDFHTLAAAVNVALVCSETIDQLVEQSCMTGRDALMRVFERHQRLGSWGMDGPAIAEIEVVIGVYEQLTQLLTGGQLKDAMTECIRRMNAGEYLGD